MITLHPHSPTLLKPVKPVGIVGYGAYVPRYRLPAREVARVWTGGKGGLPIKEKAAPGLDEDVITMSIEAARNAMLRAQIDPHELRAVWVGSESHPYAVFLLPPWSLKRLARSPARLPRITSGRSSISRTRSSRYASRVNLDFPPNKLRPDSWSL